MNLNDLFTWLIRTSAMAGILVILVVLVSLMAGRKFGAHWRYLLWLLVVARLLLPFSFESVISIYNLTGVYQVNELSGKAESTAAQPESLPLMETQPDAATPSTPALGSIKSVLEHPFTPVSITFMERLLVLWLAGVVLFGIQAILTNIRFWRIIRKEGSLLNIRAYQTLEKTRLKMKIHTHIPLIESNQIQSSALFGFIRPRLLMPKVILDEMNDQELHHIMLHELAHFKRKDIVIGWMTMLLQVVHWFNPLLWYAFYRIRQEREIACDMLALSYLKPEESTAYGLTLLKLAEKVSLKSPLSAVAGMNDSKTLIKERILAIKKRVSLSKPRTVLASFLFMMLLGITLTNPLAGGVIASSAAIPPEAGNPLLQEKDQAGRSAQTAVPDEQEPYAFSDPGLEKAVTALLKKAASEVTYRDIQILDTFSVIGPYAQTGLEFINGFGADCYYDVDGKQHREVGQVRSLADLEEFRNLSQIEISWQEALDPSTLHLPPKTLSVRFIHDALTDLSFLSGFAQVEQLMLDHNAITDISPLGNLKHLTQLSVGDNAIRSIQVLTGLENLSWLELSGNPIEDLSPLEKLTSLQSLYAVEVSGLRMENVIALKHLKNLNMSQTGLSSLEGVEALVHLEFLSMSGNRIRDIGPLLALEKLKFLDLSGNPLADLSVLLELPSLETLILSGVPMDSALREKLEQKGVAVQR